MFLKRLTILTIMSVFLAMFLYGNYAYADRFAWSESYSNGYNVSWSNIEISTSGAYFYAIQGKKNLFYSTNNGASWNSVYNFSQFEQNEIVNDMAVSYHGDKIFVATNRGLYFSNNYAATFITISSFDHKLVYSVSMADDAINAFASADTFTGYSTDGGNSFTTTPNKTFTYAKRVDASADGSIVYAVDNTDCFNYSTDGGVSFTADCAAATNLGDIATNDDGQYILATQTSSGNGRLRLSSDYGATFTYAGPVQLGNEWSAVTVSGDGSRMAAVYQTGGVYVSNDYGVTWGQELLPPYLSTWTDIFVTPDANLISAVSSDAYIWYGINDVIAPNILSINSSASNGIFRAGDSIPFTVIFSEALYYSDSTLSLVLETGDTDRTCVLEVSDSDNVGTCTYVVQAGDISADLSVASTSGYIRDENDNRRITGFSNLNTLATSKNFVIDAVAPSVSLTEPTIGTYASSTISLTATASDANLVGVQFKYNNTNIGSEDISSPYTVSWDTTGVSDGTYTINAVARDSVGYVSTSSVSIIVNNVAPDAPTVTSPVDGFASEDLEYTIGGSCESGAEVSVSNSNLVTSPITVTCASNLYSADIEFNSGTIGIESVSVTQTDEGGKISASTTSTIEIQSVTPPSSPATSTPSSSQSSFGSLTSKSGGSSPSPSLFQGGIPLNQITQLNNNNNNNNIAISESQISASKKLFDAELTQQFRFTKDLSIGVTDEDVKNLQKILNITGFEVSDKGAGSIGNETSVFGEKTMTALRRFQKAFGIIPMSGYFGYITRYILNDILDVIGY